MARGTWPAFQEGDDSDTDLKGAEHDMKAALRPLALLTLAALATVRPAAADDGAMTPIVNVATATWSDANANTYAPVTYQLVITLAPASRPLVAVLKEAFRNDQATPIALGGTVLPGELVQYRVTVTNTGDADASNLHLDDLLPAEVAFQTATPDAAGWTLLNTGNDVDADLAGVLAPTASRSFWIQVQVN